MANQAFKVSIVSGTATSTVLDLGSEAGFRKSYLRHTAGGAIEIHASTDGTTFSPLQVNLTATNAVGYTTHVVGSIFSGRWVPFDSAFQYIQIVADGTHANGNTINFATSY